MSSGSKLRLRVWVAILAFLPGAIPAGDAQGVSSIEGPEKWTLEEAWIEKNFHGNQFSALIGRYDLNSEFDHLHAADLFLNSSFGIGPEFSQSGQGRIPIPASRTP